MLQVNIVHYNTEFKNTFDNYTHYSVLGKLSHPDRTNKDFFGFNA